MAPSPKSRWAAPRCGYRSSAAVLWVASLCRPAGDLLVLCGALIFYLGVPRARRASLSYLTRILGPRPFLRRHADTFRHMWEYGTLILDRALMLARPNHGFAVSVEGLPLLAEALGSPTGALLLSAHLGVTEAAAPSIRQVGITRPLHIVMYQDPSDGTEQFHSRHRQMLTGVSVISTTDPLSAGLKIMAALHKGDLVAMRADRTMEGKGIPVTLLDSPVLLPAGPFLASALSGAPTLYLEVVRIGRRAYRCLISQGAPPPQGLSRDERIAHAAQSFACHLEAMTRRHPLQWGNFYDLWRTQAVTSSCPSETQSPPATPPLPPPGPSAGSHRSANA